MIFAAILAGGIGSRMGNNEKPKQFLSLGNKPILIHTIEKFSLFNNFEKILVLTPKDYISHTNDLIDKHIENNEKIIVLEGGNLRNDTIMNGISYIKENFNIDDESLIVTHDAVRPFLTYKIIEDNITFAKKYGACDTVIPATDTIVEADGGKVSAIPKRDNLYQGQTPQSFKINKLDSLYNNLSLDEKNSLTDACKIFVLNNEDVYLVDGDETNIKITHPYDLQVANVILNETVLNNDK
ncbi:MAG: 2-C-methyl-D-erythritol 4-phosphate cytidylyltransferase [Methanobacteriaceae archaeon]|jgi:2-C-methyl-D-erythritol 4-phosphate cytidylyltransferase|nr:2-C-methyl-D-erythritol 4-phosphate cytidylyltransferase [Methanobacteriaceae archaeon]